MTAKVSERASRGFPKRCRMQAANSCELIASPVSRKISRAVRVHAPFGNQPVGLRVALAGIVSGSMFLSKILRQASMLAKSVLSATTTRDASAFFFQTVQDMRFGHSENVGARPTDFSGTLLPNTAHFPTQKSRKITSSKSSMSTRPVMRPSDRSASRRSSAINSGSSVCNARSRAVAASMSA